MRLWTSQQIGFYNDLMENGIAFCDRISFMAKEYDFAYKWMAEQTRLRIGEPPLPQITLPVWAWYQYDSRKKKKPPLSPYNKTDGIDEMMMEIEVPDNEVLLSDFMLWHHPLNGWDIITDKRLKKKVEEHFFTNFNEKPKEIQELIKNSWTRVFNLKTRDREYASQAIWNRSIQATLWCVRKEYLISAVRY